MRNLKIAIACVGLTGIFALYQNQTLPSDPMPPQLVPMPSLGAVTSTGKCTLRPTAAGTPYYNSMIAGGLNHSEILAHAANRLGYGVSPFGPVQPSKATDCTTVFLANEVAAQLTAYRPDGFHLAMIRDRVLPMTRYSNYHLNRAVSRYQNTDTTLNSYGRLWYWARTSLVKLMTLRELLGSQKIHSNGIFDSQINLQSVMAQFWINHFNVDASKAEHYFYGSDGYVEIPTQRWLYSFQDMTTMVMRTPAMLAYLDNRTNKIDPITKLASNQNLGRELLELYTLGVPPSTGVYTQKDVEAAAQILAGHSAYPYKDQTSPTANGYVFNRTLSANFSVTVMGVAYAPAAAGAVADTRLPALIARLATNPYTKKNICGKLAKQFVQPSYYASISTACVGAWGTNGNFPAIYKAIFAHPYFWARANYRQLYRGPLEIPVVTARAMGYNLSDVYSTAMAQNQPARNFAPESSTPSQFVAFQNANASTSVTWGFSSIHEQATTLLGHRRGEVPPPIGLSNLGQDFLSSYFIDNVSRIALESGVYMAGQASAYRNDVVSPASNSAFWASVPKVGMPATVQNYVQLSMNLGAVTSFTASTYTFPYKLQPSHASVVMAVANNTAMQPVWTSSNAASVTHGLASTILGTSEFLKK